MKKPKRRYKSIFVRIVIAVVLAGLCVLLVTLARNNPEKTARVFAPFSRTVSAFLSRLFSFTSLPISEFLFYLLILFSTITLVRAIILMFRRKSMYILLSWVSTAVLTSASLLFLFFGLWGLNYFTPPLTASPIAETNEQSVELLYQTAVWLRDEMNVLAELTPRDENGVCDAGGFVVLAPRAALGYNALAEKSELYIRDPAPPKRMAFPTLLARLGISGIYVPFTGEAIVDTDALDAHLPFTICHELAHRMGRGPEEEANYYAFLACVAHPDPVYRYSGYHLAYIYCANALSGINSELSDKLWAEVSSPVLADLQAQREHVQKFEGPLQSVGEAANDRYLQSMGQEQGVKSYGMVVDLLIHEYLIRFGEKQ